MNSIDLRCLEKMFVDTRFSQQRARQSNLTKLTRNHKILGGAKRLQQFNGARKNGHDCVQTLAINQSFGGTLNRAMT